MASMRSFSLNCLQSSSSGSSISSRFSVLPPRPLSGVVSEMFSVLEFLACSVVSLLFSEASLSLLCASSSSYSSTLLGIVISMYFHPHSTHSTPPRDSPGALRYHSGDHPRFTSLCHLPDILVGNPCLNSSDLSTSGPRDLRTSESRSLVGTSRPSLSQLCLRYSIPFNTFRFPFRNHCMYILPFPFRHSFA